jgi:hypothetical protein
MLSAVAPIATSASVRFGFIEAQADDFHSITAHSEN